MHAPTARPRGSPRGSPNEELLLEAFHGATRVLSARLRPVLEGEGLSAPMFWALHHLVAEGPANVGQIATACTVTSANVSPAVDDLVREGLVEREPSPRDRRVVVLSVTPRGRTLYRAVWSRVAEVLLASLRGVPPHDLEVTARVLRRLATPREGSVPRVEVPLP